ncbi:MAG: sugar isomerase [Gemmatimonadota bacterium]
MDPDTDFTPDPDRRRDHEADLDELARRLDRRGIDRDTVVDRLASFQVAIPSWALGTGGTRFGRFPGVGEPRDVYEKMDDIAVIHRLTRATPRVSLHIPWDEPDDPDALKAHATRLGLGFDAVNSNTFQDQPGQALSYKHGSLSHTDPAVREQAVAHNLHVIDVGRRLGSKSLTVWLADGSSYPGQMHLRKGFERTLDGLRRVYAGLPDDWRMFTEHKPYEPAFYATVVQDWGSSLMIARALGDRASCLVDLGHHLPNFNDAKYGDDDLTAGSIKPFQLFLVMNELVDASLELGADFTPAYMIDQSHTLKDPIEALLMTVEYLQQAFARALLVDRDALAHHQDRNDIVAAESTLRDAYETDVRPLVAEARRQRGGALDPVAAFRASGYRDRMGRARRRAGYAPPQSL